MTGCANIRVDVLTGVSDEKTHQDLKIYPNPTSGLLTVRGTDLQDGRYILKICSVIGQELYREEVIVSGQSIIKQLDVSNYFPGMYFLTIETNKTIKVFKVQKL